MRRVSIYISIFAVTLLTGISLFFYIQRSSRPTIVCTSLDDSIRPQDYCLMNPFRDKQPEVLAEKVLEDLKNRNTDALLPFLRESKEDTKNHFLEREKQYKIKYWRIGGRRDSADNISVTYWVGRENYPAGPDGSDALEEVSFYFARESNELKPQVFTAIY